MPDGFLMYMAKTFGKMWVKGFTACDFEEIHQRGECNRNCPWCVEESADLGGEG